MDTIMELLEFNSSDQKRKMGRPAKIPAFSHYVAYKKEDVDFFISLLAGREELYRKTAEFNLLRQRAFHLIEKKCGHFLAVRKGRNAEKLWLYLFNDFEEFIQNGSDLNNEMNKSIAVFYDGLKFLIPYLEKSDKDINTPQATEEHSTTLSKNEAKRIKLDQEFSEEIDGEWLQKAIETVINQQSINESMNFQNIVLEATEVPKRQTTIRISEKHSDILSCVNDFLEEVPNEKLMLCKVRLFQFIQDEKSRLSDNR